MNYGAVTSQKYLQEYCSQDIRPADHLEKSCNWNLTWLPKYKKLVIIHIHVLVWYIISKRAPKLIQKLCHWDCEIAQIRKKTKNKTKKKTCKTGSVYKEHWDNRVFYMSNMEKSDEHSVWTKHFNSLKRLLLHSQFYFYSARQGFELHLTIHETYYVNDRELICQKRLMEFVLHCGIHPRPWCIGMSSCEFLNS